MNYITTNIYYVISNTLPKLIQYLQLLIFDVMKLFIRLAIFAFFIQYHQIISADQIRIGSIKSDLQSAIDIHKGNLWVINFDTLKLIKLDSLRIVSTYKISAPMLIGNDSIHYNLYYIPVVKDGLLYIVYDQGGEVYKWDKEFFSRIDNSFTHKMQVASTVFEYDNKICRFGGYGFWSKRNFFTYFEKNNNEWEVIWPNADSDVPEGSTSSKIKIIESKFYLFDGKIMSKIAPFTDITYDEVWRFDFLKKEWKNLGKLNEKLFDKYSIDYKNKYILVDDDYIYVLDFKKNEFKTFKNSNDKLKITSDSYYLNGNFYVICGDNGTNPSEDFCLAKIAEKDFFGEYLNSGKIYYTSCSYLLPIIILVSALSIILFWFYNRKRHNKTNKIIVVSQKFVYGENSIDADDIHIKIVNRLLTLDETPTWELFQIIHKEHLHPSQNSRILSATIDEINFKLRVITGANIEFIKMKKSELDKRMKVYSIDKRWF